jgi:hypothetical protein
MSILDTFGRRASEIHTKAEEFARCLDIVQTYAADTLKGWGQAEHQLVAAIGDLEGSARILRQILLDVEARRHVIENTPPAPALQIGQSA